MFSGTYTCAFLSIFKEIFRKYQKVFTLKMTDYSQKREVCFNIQRNLFNIFNNLNRRVMKKTFSESLLVISKILPNLQKPFGKNNLYKLHNMLYKNAQTCVRSDCC